jgi:hypothetical protein
MLRLLWFRLGLAAFAAWLLAVAVVLFDVSDLDGAHFRCSGMGHAYARHDYYPSCGNGSPRQLDAWENVGYHYHEMMRRIDWFIADWKGEPALDFEWVKRRNDELDRRRHSGRMIAEGMSRPPVRP